MSIVDEITQFSPSTLHHVTTNVDEEPVVDDKPEKTESTVPDELWQNQSVPGVFLVDWEQWAIDDSIAGLNKFVAIEARFDVKNKQLIFVQINHEIKNQLIVKKRWSENLHDLWVDSLKGVIKEHGVVFSVGKDSKDVIRAGMSQDGLLVLDLEDIKTFSANSDNCLLLMNSFWVLTHELLVHFFLKLTHGTHYVNYDINTYRYDEDETLKLMSRWSIDMGLPDRLQHPPHVVQNKREYIYLDPYPDRRFDDLLDDANDERVRRYSELRGPVQNQLVVPPDLQQQKGKYYPLGWFVDDDTEVTGKVVEGRKEGYGRWRFRTRLH